MTASAGTGARHELALQSKLFRKHGHLVVTIVVLCVKLRKHP